MGYRAISAWCPLMTSLVLLLVFSDWGALGACPRAKALEEPQPWYGGASVFLISEDVECVDYELAPNLTFVVIARCDNFDGCLCTSPEKLAATHHLLLLSYIHIYTDTHVLTMKWSNNCVELD